MEFTGISFEGLSQSDTHCHCSDLPNILNGQKYLFREVFLKVYKNKTIHYKKFVQFVSSPVSNFFQVRRFASHCSSVSCLGDLICSLIPLNLGDADQAIEEPSLTNNQFISREKLEPLQFFIRWHKVAKTNIHTF